MASFNIITDKCMKFLEPVNKKRIKIICTVDRKEKEVCGHNIGNKSFGHYENNAYLKNIKADVLGDIGYIKKEMVFKNVKFFDAVEDNKEIEFYAEVHVSYNSNYTKRNTLELKYPKWKN